MVFVFPIDVHGGRKKRRTEESGEGFEEHKRRAQVLFRFPLERYQTKKKRYMSEVNNKDQKVNEPFHLARVLTNCSWQMQTRGNDGVLLLENLSGVSAHENDPYENNTFLVVRWTRL